MGWKHVRMRVGDRFQDAVLALRAAEMIGDEALPAGIRSLVTEDGDGGWDDIVEVGEDEVTGRWTCRTQVKSAELVVDRDELRRLLAEMAGSTRRHRLVVAAWAAVPGVGSLAALRTLTQRCGAPNAAPERLTAALTEIQGAWFGEARLAMPHASDSELVAVLARLTIRCDGDRDDVWHTTEQVLARYFDSGQVARAVLMEALAEATTSDSTVTADWLLPKFEGRTKLRTIGQPRGARALRRAVVADCLATLSSVAPLDALAPTGRAWEAGVTLEAIVVPPSVVFHGAVKPTTEFLEDLQRGPVFGPYGVEGPVGSGKSTVLLTLAAALLRPRAGATPPLALLARATPTGLEPLPGFHDPGLFASVLESPFLPKGLLVDGLDEVDSAGLRAAREELRRLTARGDVAFCVVAGRPWAFLTWPSVRRHEVEPWTPPQVVEFLNRWAVFDAAAVAAVRSCPHAGELLRWPLTATLLLRVASAHPLKLGRRFDLFAEIAASMFVDWASTRIGSREEASGWWEVGRGGFEALALRAWAAPDGMVTEAEVCGEVERALGSGRGRRAVELSDRMVGLLVSAGGGRFRFAYRWVLEHLVGEHIASLPAEAPVVPTRASDVEVARHAIDATVGRVGSGAASDAIEALLAGLRSGPGCAGLGLPALLAAIRVCTDTDSIRAATVDRLADCVVERLVDESSTWVGDEVLGFLRDTDPRSTLACAVRDRLKHWEPGPPCTPAAWLRSNLPADLDTLTPWLLHRDAEVRAVAADTLPHRTDGETLEELLVTMLHDAGSPMAVEVPAVRAARALRPLLQARAPDAIPMPYLRELLEHGGQLLSFAVAIAVPTSFEPALRIRAFQGAHNLFGGVRDLLEELDASPEFGTLLNSAWPTWREGGFTPHPASPCNDQAPTPPLSPTTRLRVLRALAPAADVLGNLFSDLVRRPRLDFHEVVAICDAGQRTPGLIVDLLRRPIQPWTIFPDEAVDLIGAAASRHPEVRRALLERWNGERTALVKVHGSYPGDALVHLVLAGDTEAEAAYAEWLPRSYIGGFVQRVRPGTEAVARPRVESVARKAAVDLWAWGKPHVNDKGEPERGHPNTVGAGLRHWWPAWVDTEVTEELWGWLEGSDAERAGAAVDALLAGPLPAPWAGRLPAALAALLSRLLGSKDFIERGVLCSVMTLLVGEPVVPAMLEAVRQVAGASRGELHLAAAAALLPCVDEDEARALSRSAAQAWPAQGFLRGRVDGLLPRLVEANPDAWAERANEVASAGGMYASGDIEQLLRVAPRTMASRLERVIDDLERVCPMIPWISRSDRIMDITRPADVAQRLRYLHGRSTMLPREG